MLFGRLNVQTALVLVLVASCSFGTTSAPRVNVNSTAEPSNNTDSVGGSEAWEDLSKNCSSAFGASNNSEAEENATSTSLGCFEDKTEIPEMPPYGSNILNFAWAFHLSNCLAIWSVVGNSLTLAAIIRYEALHTPVYILMANLAASDIVAGVSFLTIGLTIFFHAEAAIRPPIALRRFLFASAFLSALSSAYSLLALTAERYRFIVHGMTYESNITNDRCKIVITVVWMWSSILALLPAFGWNCDPYQVGCAKIGGGTPHSYLVLILILVFIPILALMYFNIRVFRCLWRQVSDIRRQEAAVQAQPSTSRKSAITILIITVAFLVGWLPYCIVVATKLVCQGECDNEHTIMLTFAILNSAINPVIYGFRLEEIRRHVKRLFVGRAVNAWSP